MGFTKELQIAIRERDLITKSSQEPLDNHLRLEYIREYQAIRTKTDLPTL